MFNWKKGILFGLLLWVIMFVIASIFVAFKLPTESVFFNIFWIVLSAIVVFICAHYLMPRNISQAILYGLIFAVIGIVLDLIISARFVSGLFASVYYWISYLVVILTPMLRVKKMSAPVMPPTQP